MSNSVSSRYRPVRAVALGSTHAAVRVRVEGEMVWLPRTCLEDLGDVVDTALKTRVFMPQVELSVAIWKAKELGWT